MALHDPRPRDLNPDDDGGGATEPRTFGRYLLFKRLRKDALGEVHRAGQVGADAIERIVSLRLFNAAEIEGERFREACRERDALQTVLRGGPFGEIVDFGCEEGTAFVAHEYVFGRSLAELLAQARQKEYPVPLEHALHVMDRIAIGLQNAYETRLGDDRITHGFLVPDFIHISCEGEVRLTGFESAGGLLNLQTTAPARAALAGYISPEVTAGQPAEANDDVYSLGSILGELLTGEPMPALNPAESSRWVASATLAGEPTPLPENIRMLLRESLLPRNQRIKKAEQWHKALVEITSAGGQVSTTFDVAFYMHTLFGDELDREAELVKAEMQAKVPPPRPKALAVEAAPAPAAKKAPAPPTLAERLPELAPPTIPETKPAPPAAVPAEEPEAPHPARAARTEARAQAAAREPSARRWIAIGAIALVAGIGTGAYFLFGQRADSSDRAPIRVAAAPRVDLTAPAEAADDLSSTISAVPLPLSPEELEQQVRSLVAQRAGDLQANLRAEYDQRLVELRRQLEEAKKVTVAAPEPPMEAPAAVAAPQQPKPTAREERTASIQPAQAATPPAAEPVSLPPATAEPQPASARPEVTDSPSVDTTRSEAAPVETPERQPAPKPEAVEAGAVVSVGPGVTPPTLVRQPSAVYPPAAARLKRQATVKLRILVDEQGNPAEVEQVSKKVGLGFDASALRAAKKTLWTPPQKDGVPVKMWVELSIDFRP